MVSFAGEGGAVEHRRDKIGQCIDLCRIESCADGILDPGTKFMATGFEVDAPHFLRAEHGRAVQQQQAHPAGYTHGHEVGMRTL